jgi:hypothetical protein
MTDIPPPPSDRPARPPAPPLPHRTDTSRNGIARELRTVQRRLLGHDSELLAVHAVGALVRVSLLWLAALSIAVGVLLWRSCK